MPPPNTLSAPDTQPTPPSDVPPPAPDMPSPPPAPAAIQGVQQQSGASNPSLTDPNAIIPGENQPPPGMPMPQTPSPVAAAAEKKRKTDLRYQEIRIQAEKDMQVVRMREKADKEGTMEDRRAAFREYYRLLFAKIKKIDPTLTEKADLMQNAYLRRLAQVRLEPTIPDYPPPTPEPVH